MLVVILTERKGDYLRDSYDQILCALRAFDPEGKGYIDVANLKYILTSRGESFKVEEVEAMLKYGDTLLHTFTHECMIRSPLRTRIATRNTPRNSFAWWREFAHDCRALPLLMQLCAHTEMPRRRRRGGFGSKTTQRCLHSVASQND